MRLFKIPETVKVKAQTETGYAVIYKKDFNPTKDELFTEDAPQAQAKPRTRPRAKKK